MFTSLLFDDALKPARQAQWKDVPVFIHEVETSQRFWPEVGLQVPHGGSAATRVVVATSTVRMEKCILK